MAKINVAKARPLTHEGSKAFNINAELQLRRSVMSCMLWEDQFYEDGMSISDRISKTIPLVKPEKVSDIAIEARENMKLRHVPLLIVRQMAKIDSHKHLVAMTLERVIQRADELSEFLAIYWKEGREKLSAQVKKGLAAAFIKFSEYQLAKYNRDGAVKLRDVLFLSHAKPKDKKQASLWKRLINGTLKPAGTWEELLSAGKDKKKTWEKLMRNKELGGLALLRNLRNMQEAKVNEELIIESLESMDVSRIMPYRFISAARFVPNLEPSLEKAMFKSIENKKKIPGKTILLIDVSGSMEENLSSKSQMTRIDAACGLGILIRELCEKFDILTFSDKLVRLPARRGFALRDAAINSQHHSGTHLGNAIQTINRELEYDRIIVITDEQSHDSVPSPKEKGYVINVASYKNGIGYGPWTHIDGWSESVIDYIREIEK